MNERSYKAPSEGRSIKQFYLNNVPLFEKHPKAEKKR